MLKHINDFAKSDRPRIYYLIKTGRLKKTTDSDGYVCIDTNELKAAKPRKRGRKPKLKNE